MDVFGLRTKIKSEYFDYQCLSGALSHSSHPRRDIGKLIKDGHIIRVKKGLYIWGDHLSRAPYSEKVLSNLIYGPSYVSLEYAFSYYGLIPERVSIVTAVTPQRNKLFQTSVGTFEYSYLSQAAYPWGVTKKSESGDDVFLIAILEKALLDYIAVRIKKWDDGIKLEEFLYDDLRFDEEVFDTLDQDKIEKLSFYYKSRAIKKFVGLLLKDEVRRG